MLIILYKVYLFKMHEKKFNIYQSFLIIMLLSSQAFSCLATNYNASFPQHGDVNPALRTGKPKPSVSYGDKFDDWIVSSSCENRTAKLCHGYYLEPEYQYPLDDKTEYPTKITSDHSELSSKGASTFYGNVDIQQGNKHLKTDKATIIHNDKSGELETMHAEGNVKITEPDLRIDGSSAIIYQQENRKIIYDPTYRMYSKHARGTADSITILQQTEMALPNASYTTCAPNKNTWHLRAKKTKFDKRTGRGEAWHSWLYIKNFKVFYWPYINFPIDDRRQTGFLMPDLHMGSSNGVSLSTPFYWNMAPNYDAIISPQYMVKRGAKIDSHLRYLTNNSTGEIKFNFLPNDKAYQHFRTKSFANANKNNISAQDPKYLGLRELNKRYSFSINNKTQFNKQFKAEIDYTHIGDDNYIFDFNGDVMQQNFPLQANSQMQPGYLTPSGTLNPNYAATPAVRQKLELQHSSYLGTITSKLEQYQVLHPFDGPEAYETYRMLPALNFQSSTFDLPHDFDWSFSGNYTNFALRGLAFNAPLYTGPTALSPGERTHFQPSLRHPFGTQGWFIKPNIQLDTTHYSNMKLSNADLAKHKLTRTTRNIPIYNVDSGLVFDRHFKINNNSFLQTLEPRAYYLYVPKRAQNLLPIFDSAPIPMDYNQAFTDNRYNGFDRIGEANQLGMGVMSRFLTNSINEEKASIGISRILYFQDRISHLNERINNKARWSPMAAVAKYKIRPDWNIEGNVVKEKLNKTNSGSLTLQYITDPTHVVNFGYQFIRNDEIDSKTKKSSHLRSIQTSSAWEITPKIRLLGGLGHDLNLNRMNNFLLGVEQHNCCTIVRVVWIRNIKPTSNLLFNQYENAISLQFVLKGLTQAGNIDTNQISTIIPGYVSKDNEF